MAADNPTTVETRRLPIRLPRPLWIGLATVVVGFGVAFADRWQFLKIAIILAGSSLGILIAQLTERHGRVWTVCAGATGGFLAFGSLGFYVVLFPSAPEPGFVNWGGRSIAAATYIFFMAGLFGGFFGGIVGLVAETMAWLFRKCNTSRT